MSEPEVEHSPKQARAAQLAEKKKERRANEKEKRKEKKRKLAQQKASGEIDDAEYARLTKKMKVEHKPPFQARVIVDLGFDDLMSENEVKSLTSQLAYTYSANRKAVQPFSSVLFTSINGKTLTRLENMNDAAYKRWHSTEWWTESYERLWKDTSDSSGDSNLENKETQTTAKETVIYLTADSSDELTELKEGESYIIGGICDHNRYKNLCFNKSQEHGIRSARLPIGTYLAELKTRHVLTVNQTFEIPS
ncbi:hypothetical protein QCA50_000803 [Cerrena zonata]|uniref:tRNA (guanine(9)-N1)-methyltransferase n=1 Tax=Cerrena zonata TaxID=2478898 RepID=A0AAW0GVG6_9APHY